MRLLSRCRSPLHLTGLLSLGLALSGYYCAELKKDHVCLVVRTYWGHAAEQEAGLRGLLTSLQLQSHQDWEAVIIVLDQHPFEELAGIVHHFKDERIWVYAEWIGQQYAPKENGVWLAGYHGILYDLTDEAIRACSPKSRWVLATNGDNEYSYNAFQRLVTLPHADIVAFDFYSRYQRATGPPCLRFAASHHFGNCKKNRLRWCQTDLGAYALNWPKLISEDARFGSLAEMGSDMTPDHFDGVMAEFLVASGTTCDSRSQYQVGPDSPDELATVVHTLGKLEPKPPSLGHSLRRRLIATYRALSLHLESLEHWNVGCMMGNMFLKLLVREGWLVHHINDSCLFEHDPSPQRCAKFGGAWDDTLATAIQSPGGRCLSDSDLRQRLQEPDLELVRIDLSHDEHLATFPGGAVEQSLDFRCLVDKDPTVAHQRAQSFFPAECSTEFEDTFSTESCDAYDLDDASEDQCSLLKHQGP